MSPDIVEYLLRATAIWVVLLAYYFLALRRTDFRFQRVYLLGGWLFGMAVPLLPALAMGGGLPVAQLPTAIFKAPVFVAEAGATATATSWNWTDLLPWLYALGAILLGARTLVQWGLIWQWCVTGQRSNYAGFRVIRHAGIDGPFAAFGSIFLPERMSDTSLENTALIHETAHLRSRHHYDTILLNIGSVLLWFHPLFWVFRRLIATVHEYEADAAVIQRVPVKTYGLQLLHASLGPAGYPGLFSSPLKHRIDMITNNKRTRTLRLFPLLTLCLLLLGLVVACSDALDGTTITEPDDVLFQGENYTLTNAGIEIDSTTIRQVQTAAEALKGDLIKAIYSEIRYPVRARNTGTLGTIRTMLKIDHAGRATVESADVLTTEDRGSELTELVVVGYPSKTITGKPNPQLLAEEVIRTINSLGLFPTLGETAGDVSPEVTGISMSMKFDIIFKLEE